MYTYLHTYMIPILTLSNVIEFMYFNKKVVLEKIFYYVLSKFLVFPFTIKNEWISTSKQLELQRKGRYVCYDK